MEKQNDCLNCGDTPELISGFKDKFNSSYSKQTKYYKNHWGTYLWGFLHTICIIDIPHPIDNKIQHLKIVPKLEAILDVIPCELCKGTYREYLDKLTEIELSRSLALFHWSVDLHNKVNIKLNKRELTYQEAYSIYCSEF